MDEVSGLDWVLEELRSEVVTALRSAAARAGTLVAGFEVCYDEAYDRLDEYAQPLGPEATDAVLAGLDSGSGHPGDVTEGVPGEPTDTTAPTEPPGLSEVADGPFRDADECATAVLGWAGRWLQAAPGERVSSADLAAHWAQHVGRPLTGYYRNVSDAAVVWAEALGIGVTRYRTRTARGLAGLALVTPSVPPEADVTPLDHDAATPTDEGPVAVTPPVAEVRRRPPNGGMWQSFADLGDAAMVDAGGWFET